MNRERCLQTESSSYTEADPLTSIWRQTLELHSQIAWCEDRHYFQYDRRDAHFCFILFYVAAIFPTRRRFDVADRQDTGVKSCLAKFQRANSFTRLLRIFARPRWNISANNYKRQKIPNNVQWNTVLLDFWFKRSK